MFTAYVRTKTGKITLCAMPRKWRDVGRLAKLGWRASTSLEDGIRLAYRAYLSEQNQAAE